MAAEVVLLVGPALFMGLVIGLLEFLWVMKDEVGPSRFGHALHTVPISMIFVFLSMNVDWAIATFTFLATVPLMSNPLVFQIVIALIAGFKAYASSRVAKSTVPGLHESAGHVVLYMALIVGAPYIWNGIEPYMPEWIKF